MRLFSLSDQTVYNIAMTMDDTQWTIVDRPGYLGGEKEKKEREWDEQYGNGNWRIQWVSATGKRLTYDDIIGLYTDGYEAYFRAHPDEAKQVTDTYAYGYDLDIVTKDEAFDAYALYQKPGVRNQFHHVAFNKALVDRIGLEFRGREPLQVRDVAKGTPLSERPAGWRWNPGVIPCTKPELIPDVAFAKQPWWEKGSIEDLYQSTKVLEVKQAKNG